MSPRKRDTPPDAAPKAKAKDKFGVGFAEPPVIIAPQFLLEDNPAEPHDTSINSPPDNTSIPDISGDNVENSASEISNNILAEESDNVSELSDDAEDEVDLFIWLSNGRPPWGQAKFDCLMFTVDKLTLAVPLTLLGSIQPITHLTPMVKQHTLQLGIMRVGDENIKVIDTLKIVVPERGKQMVAHTYPYVITLYGSRLGLAVDAVKNAEMIDPNDIRWRICRDTRPWLAGTVVKHMCGLLDLPALKNMLR